MTSPLKNLTELSISEAADYICGLFAKHNFRPKRWKLCMRSLQGDWCGCAAGVMACEIYGGPTVAMEAITRNWTLSCVPGRKSASDLDVIAGCSSNSNTVLQGLVLGFDDLAEQDGFAGQINSKDGIHGYKIGREVARRMLKGASQ
jgi:hypothetical protein